MSAIYLRFVGVVLLADVAMPATAAVLIRRGHLRWALVFAVLAGVAWLITVRYLRRAKVLRRASLRAPSAFPSRTNLAIRATAGVLVGAAITAIFVAVEVGRYATFSDLMFVLALTGSWLFVMAGGVFLLAARDVVRREMAPKVSGVWGCGVVFIAATIAAVVLPKGNAFGLTLAAVVGAMGFLLEDVITAPRFARPMSSAYPAS